MSPEAELPVTGGPPPDTPSLEGGVSTARLHELLAHSPDLLAIADATGHFIWLSPSWERVTGWTREELMSRPFIAFVHHDDVEATLEVAAAMTREGRDAVFFENRYRCRDGSWRWLQWNAVVGEDGGLLSFARDITDRKQARLRDLERMRMLEMSEHLVGVTQWRVDVVEGRLHWTPGVFEIYGIPESEGEPSLESAIDAYHPDDRERVAQLVSQSIERQMGFDFRARIIRPDDEVRHVESVGVPEVNLEGEVVAIFGIFRDVTEQVRLEETVRRSERMVSVGTMAAGVAHEINNPLSYLLGNLQLIQEELERLRPLLPPQEVDELVEMISDSVAGGRRVRKIVNGMRAFSRVGRSHATVVDVRRVVDEAVGMAEHEVRLKARLVLEVNDTAPVFIDETQLVQVLVNLLVNAAQALPAGNASAHEIRLDVEERAGQVEIRVADTGPGVPRELRTRIFDPFFTTKPVGTGTGLGLAICHSIITHNGGQLELEDTATGASFLIRLPASDEVAPALPVVDEDGAGNGDVRRILIVEDEPEIVKMLVRALEGHFEAVAANSGREALEILARDTDFDVVLCDLMMPEVSGTDVIAWIDDHAPQLSDRIVVGTGGTPSDEMTAELDRLGVDLIRKPYDVIELRRRLVALGGETAITR